MEAQANDAAGEIKRLHRCINDLLSVLALPAVWSGSEPSQIVTTLLDALLGMLSLDLVYMRVNEPRGSAPVEMVRVAPTWEFAPRPQEICDVLNASLGDDPQKWPPIAGNTIGDTFILALPLTLGLQGEIGAIVAGSQRADFPRQTERLILSVAANQAAIALQEARLLREQKRLTGELDQRVAERTAELGRANDELRTEIIERKKIEERLLESESTLLKALEEIKKSEAKFRQVFDAIPTLAWCNLPDGPNEFLNKRWHDYTGLSSEESHGWGWQIAFHPEDLPPLLKKWGHMLISGEPGEIEARLRRFDGVYRWFLISAEPLRDEAGRIVRWYGTSVDIEDRKRAEDELRRSEAFLEEGQRISRTGSFSWRVSTNEVTLSEGAYRIFEFELDTPVTLERIISRIHPEDIPLLSEKMARARNEGGDQDYEIRLRMQDGAVKHVHTVSHGTLDGNDKLEWFGAIQDITQRRLSEEALGKARSELARVTRLSSLAGLTASIAHEVNQPLSGIVTNASTCLRLLAADPPNIDGARETARRTIRDGNRASEVITRLRALFTQKEGTTESFDLNEAAREVIALSLSDLQRNRVVIRSEFDADLPVITGDRVQLQQVILNLVRNASDAMNTVEDRSRELLIRTERHEGDRAQLSVRDVGVGFNALTVEGLFEPFYTTKSGGMGMGLSLSKSIIENHRGRIWATLNDGPGATFAFSVPCGTNTNVL
jgi:PAS domain S-box-containing protein